MTQYVSAVSAGATTVQGLVPNLALRSADNTKRINDAIGNQSVLGGGDLIVPAPGPASVFYVDQLVWFSYVRLVGVGRWASRLRSASAVDMCVLSDVNQEQCGIANLLLDGNGVGGGAVKFDNTGGVGFTQLGSFPRHELVGVGAKLFNADGISVLGAVGGHFLERCASYFNNGHGFNVGAPDSIVSACDSGQSGLYGFTDGGANRYVGCKAWLSGRVTPATGAGFRIRLYSMASGCHSQDNAQHGFDFFNATNAVGSGLFADSNGRGAVGYGYNLVGAQGCQVQGTANDRQGVPTQALGVNIGTGTKNVVDIVVGASATAPITTADLTSDNIVRIHSTAAGFSGASGIGPRVYSQTGVAPATSALGANVTSATPAGNDHRGRIVVVMAGALAANTRICTVTFNVSYGATSPRVILTNQTAGAGLAAVVPYVSAQATGVSFDLAADQALAAGTYEFDYIVIG